MVSIQLSPDTRKRTVSREPNITLHNRYFENNPVLNPDNYSAISRPALTKWMEVGEGHIRKVFSAPGTFGDDLFVVSGLFLYRIDRYGATTNIGQISVDITASVSMAATAPIGTGTSENLFIAEGGVLWVYTENGFAIGTLTVTGSIANGDRVVIDGVYYQFTTGSVDTGTPAGTSGSPWLVAHPTSTAVALTNLYSAINASGIPGTDYSTLLTTAHTTVEAYGQSGNDLYVAARENGVGGNSLTTTETGAGMSWGGATLSGGGSPSLRQVFVPDDVGAIDVAHINSYIIVIPSQIDELNGRFYWIEPGSMVIDPLNFATAERSPDRINQVVVFSDMFWLLGQNTTEPWVTSGNDAAPFQRFQGILFDRGSWEGTAIQVKDSLILTDEDGAVFQVRGGLERISTPDIEERIRKAIHLQQSLI